MCVNTYIYMTTKYVEPTKPLTLYCLLVLPLDL
jgi:hypothetical protein